MKKACQAKNIILSASVATATRLWRDPFLPIKWEKNHNFLSRDGSIPAWYSIVSSLLQTKKDKKLFSRRVTCKDCGFKGVVEAYDTKHLPKENVFTLLGKDREGYIYLQCLHCGADCSYGPTEFVSPLKKFGCLLLIIVVVWIIIRLLFG
jgi:hypothetical protein